MHTMKKNNKNGGSMAAVSLLNIKLSLNVPEKLELS
jgi:hypothetical protein